MFAPGLPRAGCVRLRAIPSAGRRARTGYRELFVGGISAGLDVQGGRAAAGRRLRAACSGSFVRASCAALAARVAELEKARLTDVPREEERDIPDRSRRRTPTSASVPPRAEQMSQCAGRRRTPARATGVGTLAKRQQPARRSLRVIGRGRGGRFGQPPRRHRVAAGSAV